MILKKSVPFAGSPVLLTGTTFSDVQKFLLSDYASKELSAALGEKNLRLKSAWTVVGSAEQLTQLSRQLGQHKIIIPLAGSAFVINYHHADGNPVIFRLNAGASEAVWCPDIYFQGFYFNAPNTIMLIAASTVRDFSKINSLDPTDKSNNIDLSQIVSKTAKACPLVAV